MGIGEAVQKAIDNCREALVFIIMLCVKKTMSTLIIMNCKMGPAVLTLYRTGDIVDCTYRPGRDTQHQP